MKKHMLTLLIMSMGLLHLPVHAMDASNLLKTGTKLLLTQAIGTTTGTITNTALGLLTNVTIQTIKNAITLIIIPIGKYSIVRAGRYGAVLLRNGISHISWQDAPEEKDA